MSAKKKSDYAPVVQIFAVLHADAADVERDCRLRAQSRAEDSATKTKMAKMAAACTPRTSSVWRNSVMNVTDVRLHPSNVRSFSRSSRPIKHQAASGVGSGGSE